MYRNKIRSTNVEATDLDATAMPFRRITNSGAAFIKRARRESRRKLPQPFELAAVKNNQARWQFYYIITMVANTINGEKKTYQI